MSPPKQVVKNPVWIENLSGKNVPRQRVKKMTRTKECGTKATTRKAPASKSNLANGKLSVFNVNRSVPRKSAPSGRTGKPFEGLDQIYTKSPKEPSREPHNTTVTTSLEDRSEEHPQG